MFIVANSLGFSAVCRPDETRWAKWALTIEISIYPILEIKTYRLGFRIRDMEAEWRLRVITD